MIGTALRAGLPEEYQPIIIWSSKDHVHPVRRFNKNQHEKLKKTVLVEYNEDIKRY